METERYAGVIGLGILALAGIIASVVIGIYADWQGWNDWVLLNFGVCSDPADVTTCTGNQRTNLLSSLEGWLIAFEILVVIALASPVAIRIGGSR